MLAEHSMTVVIGEEPRKKFMVRWTKPALAQPYEKEVGLPISFGRDAGNTIVLPTEGVSRHHAVIKWHNNQVTLTDQNSTNGTFLNGKRLKQAVVNLRDKIKLGEWTVTLELLHHDQTQLMPSSEHQGTQGRENRKVGKYELVERLGKGGTAQVYKAFQPGVERFVAVKVLHNHLSDSDDFVQRFQREARGVGQLQHNHIARVIDFDVDNNQYYMVMDYIQGGTLQALIQQSGALPTEKALRLAAQLADAIAYAHQQGIIHRDIKPANIMFIDETHAQALLTDFGLARLLGDDALTMTGSMIGTPAYMSPEVVRGEQADEQADVYSLGVVLYQMVTGRTPYTADTPHSMIWKQMNEPLPPPRQLKADIPKAVEQLILKALASEPPNRFQSANHFRDAIQQTLAQLGLPQPTFARATPPPPPPKHQTPALTFTLPPLAAAIGGVLLTALLMVALALAFSPG